LKQFALGMLLHAETHGYFPTGGCGGDWVGDPDRGFDRSQPGGWAFNVLPFVEQQALRDLGAGESPGDREMAAARRIMTPLDLFHCPSRRGAQPYPLVQPNTSIPRFSSPCLAAARSDYAANSATNTLNPNWVWCTVSCNEGISSWIKPGFTLHGIAFDIPCNDIMPACGKRPVLFVPCT
jgi:hypothetical protein